MSYFGASINEQPVIAEVTGAKIENGALCDLAPTLLKLLNLPQPEEMTGKALV